MDQQSYPPTSGSGMQPAPIGPAAGRPEKKPRGCLFWGCATILCLCLILSALIAYGIHRLDRFIGENTEARALELPRPDVNAAELAEVQARVEIFMRAMQTGQDAPPLVLTEDEATAWLWALDEDDILRGRVLLRFSEDRLGVFASVPLDVLPFGMGSGRYFNAAASFEAFMKNGLLFITLDSFSIKDHRFTDKDLAEIKNENLAEELYKDPETAHMMSRIKSVQFGRGRVRIELKSPEGAPEPPDLGGEQTDV